MDKFTERTKLNGWLASRDTVTDITSDRLDYIGDTLMVTSGEPYTVRTFN